MLYHQEEKDGPNVGVGKLIDSLCGEHFIKENTNEKISF